jgi:hypothetical protein
MGCLLAVSFLNAAPVANAASAGPSILNPGKNVGNNVVEIKSRGRSLRLYLPITPYIAYDFPYYYSRGFYPTHIEPGFIYYGFPYYYYDKGIYGARCSYRDRKCVAGWSHDRGPGSPSGQNARRK